MKKKILSFMLLISVLASFFVILPTTVNANRLGDVDGDGTVMVKDAIYVRRYGVGGYGITMDEIAADTYKDGIIDVKDVIVIRRYITGGYGVEL